MIPVNEPWLDGNEPAYVKEAIETGWISSEVNRPRFCRYLRKLLLTLRKGRKMSGRRYTAEFKSEAVKQIIEIG